MSSFISELIKGGPSLSPTVENAKKCYCCCGLRGNNMEVEIWI